MQTEIGKAVDRGRKCSGPYTPMIANTQHTCQAEPLLSVIIEFCFPLPYYVPLFCLIPSSRPLFPLSRFASGPFGIKQRLPPSSCTIDPIMGLAFPDKCNTAAG